MRLTTDMRPDDWDACAAAAEAEGLSLSAWARRELIRASTSPAVQVGSEEWSACRLWLAEQDLEVPAYMSKKSQVVSWARKMGWEG